MSYINDALRKAQKEKDNRYEPFGGVIAPSPEAPNRPRKRVVSGATAALAILASAVLLFAFYGLKQPSVQPKGAPSSPAAAAQTSVRRSTEKAIRPLDGPTEIGKADAGEHSSAQPKGAPSSPVTAAEASAPRAAEKTAPPPAAATKRPAAKTAEKVVRPSETREADVRYQEALIAQWAGDPRRAETIYEKVLAIDPGHVRALNNLGVIYMGRKQRQKAIELFGRAIVLKKDYVDPYYNMACLYAQANEIDDSLWYLKVAATIDGDVINWVKKDADMKNVVTSPEFKKIMEGQKN